jgi:Tol biopolymer transport system component
MQCFLPTPTPDGKRLLFYGMQERTSILKLDTKSGRFGPFLPGVSGAHLDFSRDGKWVTYSSFPDHALWRAAVDGTHRLQLSPPDMIAMLPAISPDGTKVAFVGGSPGRPFSIFVVGLDGGALQRIVSTEPTGLVETAWSPDGASLALGTLGDKSPLYRFDFANAWLAVLPGSEGLSSPRWSPDGPFIASLSSPDSRLMLYDLKSRRQTKLTDLAVFNPVWARDAQCIYFGSDKKEDEAWYRVRVRDRKLERVVSLAESGALPAKPSRGVPTWIYRWTGLAPGDSLLVAREAGSIEIYSADWVEP